MSNDLSGLIDRLARANGADGALDMDVLLALGARYELDWGPEFYWPDGSRFYQHDITAKIDDALALLAHVLPGWFLYHLGERVLPIVYAGDTHQNTGEGFRAEIQMRAGGGLTTEHGATPALAVCLATLRALKAHSPNQAVAPGHNGGGE